MILIYIFRNIQFVIIAIVGITIFDLVIRQEH